LTKSPTTTPRVLLDGLAYVESPRWHDGRLWFAHWGAEEIVAVDVDGSSEVAARGAPGLGWSIDWLADGRLLVTGAELLRQEPNGATVRHVDLSDVGDYGWNEIVVDGRGNVYVNTIGFDFGAGEQPKPGLIALITPDGVVRRVADELEFANGMAITPDNSTLIVSESFAGRLTAFNIETDGGLSHRRVWADRLGPDSICLDADGAVWTHSADTRPHTGRDDSPEGECVRVREGGRVLERIELDRAGFACALGGPDRRTLFMLAAEWNGVDNVDAAIAKRTGQVLAIEAPAPGVGWP
jgi:sugar lactone lactonase YvrE